MKNKRPSRAPVVLLTCTLAVPTTPCLMYRRAMSADFALLKPYLLAGLLLGAVHLLIRPLLRLLTAPIGCLTLGLSGVALDVGLIYLAAALVEGFVIPEFLCALLTALLINAVCGIFAR